MTKAKDGGAAGARLAITPRHPLIGAEVRGVDLSAPIDDAVFAEIYQAWLAHLVLVFPDQPISDAQHIAFSRRFGELEIHPAKAHRSSHAPEIYRVTNVDEAGNILPPESEAWRYTNISWLWHSDSSFRQVPSSGSILHGIELPPTGGDTLFCNLYEVYEALPEATKRRAETQRVLHSHDTILQRGKVERSSRYESLDGVNHPLVRRHPVTGRLSLFISPHTMAGIEGMADADARAFLEELTQFATQERFVYRHNWRKDDIIMWDNRCTMHAVMPYDNAHARRILHRTTLVGDGPVLAAADEALQAADLLPRATAGGEFARRGSHPS
jgi:taurine dioxygenase